MTRSWVTERTTQEKTASSPREGYPAAIAVWAKQESFDAKAISGRVAGL
jgi:hypothetical protein